MDERAIRTAYFAGIVDGEGHVSLSKNRQREMPQALITVGMTHEATIRALHAHFGVGSTRRREAAKEGWLPQWVWTAKAKMARTVIAELLPYLITKADIARDILAAEVRPIGWKPAGWKAQGNTIKHHITYNGRTQTVGEWAAELGVHHKSLYQRLFKLRWPVERAFTQRMRPFRLPRLPPEVSEVALEGQYHRAEDLDGDDRPLVEQHGVSGGDRATRPLIAQRDAVGGSVLRIVEQGR